MKNLVIAALTIISLNSCRRDDTPAAPTPILPVEIVYDRGTADASTEKFSYNADKLSTITRADPVNGNSTTNFEYTGDLITKETWISKSHKGETNYTYSNGKLTSSDGMARNINGSQTTTSSSTFTYAADGTVTQKMTSKVINGNNVVSITNNTFIYTIANNQVVKTTQLWGNNNEHSSTAIYSYDGKNSPSKNIKGFQQLLLDPVVDLQGSPQQNYLLVKNQDTGIQQNYIIEYNADGFPTKISSFAYNNPSNAEEILWIVYNK